MDRVDRKTAPLLSRTSQLGFALLFVAGLIIWLGFGSTTFVDLATTLRSCF